ncbi:MAG: FAD:protein FMN transferase [Anaerohalosphaeraceae bacterium]|nr:FAD:protein FMN transferase [Anaerohalosphaeraceae bacterium]
MNQQKLKIIITFVIAITSLLFLLNKSLKLHSEKDIVSQSGQRLVMGTFAKITVVARTKQIADDAIAGAMAKIELVEKMMSRYDSDSQLSRVNANAFNKPVEVAPELFVVLRKSIEYSKKSNGAFDITVAPLIIFWEGCAKANAPPTAEQLKKAHEKIGYEKLIFNTENRTVKFEVDGMMLDLGAIAKGYAIDAGIEAAKSAGADGAMVDVGGDIKCFGKSPTGNGWTIGLQNPEMTHLNRGRKIYTADILLKLNLSDKAIATSGDYQRYAIIAGKRYSHIINPTTNTGAYEMTSVTIIADKAIDADAMATTVSVLGIEKGLELVEKTPRTEAIIIPATDKTELIKSSGAGDIIID